MCTDRLSTIGSGVRVGTLGIVLGIGVTGRVGGTHTLVGHMTGIGIVATPITTIITTARSATYTIRTTDTTSYTAV